AELTIFVQQLQNQIDAINNDLVSHRQDLDSLTLQINDILTDLSNLEADITSLNSAVAALQTLTSQITGTLVGNMIPLEIGEENALAGPIYETVLRRNDRTRFNGYVEAFGPALSLPNNPLNASN